MKKNMGLIDRLVRLVIVVAFVLLACFKIVTGTLAILLLVIAAVFTVTSVFGICPLYKVAGINTCPKQS